MVDIEKSCWHYKLSAVIECPNCCREVHIDNYGDNYMINEDGTVEPVFKCPFCKFSGYITLKEWDGGLDGK